jgi:hypothetical protein
MDYDSVNFEILKITRELVINEYTDRRAEQHNKWLVESEHLWRTQRLRLAYPTIPPYPTEEDIIRRAKLLIEFVQKEESKKDVVDTTLTTQEIVELEEQEAQLVQAENVKELVEDARIVKDEVSTEKTSGSEPDVNLEQETGYTGRILPSVLKKIEDLKNNWRK